MRDSVLVVAVIFVVGLVLFGSCYAYPKYNIYKREMSGKAELAEAEWNRQIKVEEAKAELEAAKLKRESEIERAKGVAEANKIIGDSLQGKEEYLRYLWIQGLQDGSSEVIYVPTEAGLPILEAGRLGADKAAAISGGSE